MLISRAKRKSNIIEYLLYMYQVEDIIRSFQFNLTTIDTTIVQKYDQTEEVKQEIKMWYAALIDKMRMQRIERSGHLGELKELVIELQNLHDSLLTTYYDKAYIDLYDGAQSYLKELTVKTVGQNLVNQIDVALHGVYGLFVMRLKQQEVGEETEQAMQKITAFLAYLAHQFHKMESGELNLSGSIKN